MVKEAEVAALVTAEAAPPERFVNTGEPTVTLVNPDPYPVAQIKLFTVMMVPPGMSEQTVLVTGAAFEVTVTPVLFNTGTTVNVKVPKLKAEQGEPLVAVI